MRLQFAIKRKLVARMYSGYGSRAKRSPSVDYFLPKPVHFPGGRLLGQCRHKEQTTGDPKLLEPYKIKSTVFQNRIGVSPMCTYSAAPDGETIGHATKFHEINYGSFALRGPGLIILETAAVCPEGRTSPEDLGIWLDSQAESLRPIVDFAHAQGVKIGIQIGHGGRKASGLPLSLHLSKAANKASDQGWDIVGPSAISFDEELFPTPREMTLEEIQAVVRLFKDAARRSLDISGFDFVEIHAAHGFLLNNFLSELSNKRTDRYGGSFLNRTRLLLEIIDEVKDDEHPLFVRVSATDRSQLPEAWKLEHTQELALLLEDHGVDVIDVSDGGNFNRPYHLPHVPANQAPLAKGVRDTLRNRGTKRSMLVATVGSISSGLIAEEKLEDGSADVILSGREFLINPGAAIRFAQDLGYSISSGWPYEWTYEPPPLTDSNT